MAFCPPSPTCHPLPALPRKVPTSKSSSNSSQVTNLALSQLSLRKLGIYRKSARLSSPSLPGKDLQSTPWSLQTCISLKTRNVFFSQASSGGIPRTAPASVGDLPPLCARLSRFYNSTQLLPASPKFSCSLQMIPS